MRSINTALGRTKQISHHITRTMATAAPAAAPWRSTFLSNIKEMGSPEFTLGTLHPQESSSSGPQFTPRVRTVIYRGMWAELPVNPKNTAELNPAIYQSDLLTFTTDARMDKVPELFDSTAGSQRAQSGPGGPVEAVFWATKPQAQWRLRGRAYVIGPDISTPAGAPVRAALDAYMRRGGNGGGAWDWAREVTAHFGNLSPMMRGTFRNPPPGTPLSEDPGEGLGLGHKVDDLEDKLSRANFRVVVIVPEEVDRVDLSDQTRPRRWNYVLNGDNGEWTATELWP